MIAIRAGIALHLVFSPLTSIAIIIGTACLIGIVVAYFRQGHHLPQVKRIRELRIRIADREKKWISHAQQLGHEPETIDIEKEIQSKIETTKTSPLKRENAFFFLSGLALGVFLVYTITIVLAPPIGVATIVAYGLTILGLGIASLVNYRVQFSHYDVTEQSLTLREFTIISMIADLAEEHLSPHETPQSKSQSQILSKILKTTGLTHEMIKSVTEQYKKFFAPAPTEGKTDKESEQPALDESKTSKKL